MKPRGALVLFNPISGHGHLDSWHAMFAGILLERGYGVLAMTPDRDALARRLESMGLASHPRLEILDWSALDRGQPLADRARRLLRWWWVSSEFYGLARPGSVPGPDTPALERWKKRVLGAVIPPLYRATRFVVERCPPLREVVVPGGVDEADTEPGLLDPEDSARRIAAAVRAERRKPGFVFNMYMDMYKTAPGRWRAYEAACPLPWGGIRFVPQGGERAESYFSLSGLRGMCFLDEFILDSYARQAPGKTLGLLPDITSPELPASPPALVEELRRLARGRKVVFLGGSIGGQKNLARWEGLIRKADPERFFFVQAGEIHPGSFTPEEAAALERLKASPPENFLLHPFYLESDEDFNAVIAASDLIFAVYRDFRISSNMPGKAACFGKPILVAAGHLMGARVERYGIVLVVPEQDEQAMLAALERLADEPVPPDRFAAYREAFSPARLAEALDDFVTTCFLGAR